MRKNSEEFLNIVILGITNVGLNINSFVANASTRLETHGSQPYLERKTVNIISCVLSCLCLSLEGKWPKPFLYSLKLGGQESSKDSWETHRSAPERCRNPSTRNEVCYCETPWPWLYQHLSLSRSHLMPQLILLRNFWFWSSLGKQERVTCLQVWSSEGQSYKSLCHHYTLKTVYRFYRFLLDFVLWELYTENF